MLGLLKKRRAVFRLLTAAACVLAASLLTAAWRWAHAPHVWKPEEVPVAFWAWRAQTPAQEEVDRAVRETGARTLFLRAGQLDLASGRVSRVRAVTGRMPRGVELHLVYNATPALLAGFEGTDEKELAAAVAGAFRQDAAREGDGNEDDSQGRDGGGEGDGHGVTGGHVGQGGGNGRVGGGHGGTGGARVIGLQLDLDVPTRLLARYGRVLRETRALLPEGTLLSVTGLQTWMGAGELRGVLDAVDFWAPQFYGAEIPATVERVVPIASPGAVSRAVARARELGKPFYAGLAAYGYALLYTEKGKLLEARGDIAPARVAADRNFELVERRAFEPGAGADGAGAAAPLASEWRYVFRARDDAVIEGLVVRAREQIVLDVPSSQHLRASVRGVREGAGEKLLGICLFRLPTRDDPTTLGLAQIAAALGDREAATRARLSVEQARAAGGEKIPNQLLLTAENEGAGVALFGDGALVVTLRVPRGSVRGVTRLEGFDSFETLCEAAAPTADSQSRSGADARGGAEAHMPARVWSDEQARAWQAALRPCSAARASVLRLGARGWPEGARARAGLSFEGDAPAALSAAVAVRRDDGRVWEMRESLSLKGEGR